MGGLSTAPEGRLLPQKGGPGFYRPKWLGWNTHTHTHTHTHTERLFVFADRSGISPVGEAELETQKVLLP